MEYVSMCRINTSAIDLSPLFFWGVYYDLKKAKFKNFDQKSNKLYADQCIKVILIYLYLQDLLI